MDPVQEYPRPDPVKVVLTTSPRDHQLMSVFKQEEGHIHSFLSNILRNGTSRVARILLKFLSKMYSRHIEGRLYITLL